MDKGHGRLEVRRYWIVEDIRTLLRTEQWKNLRSIGMVERTCTEGSVTTIDERYFMNSIAADVKIFANAVCGRKTDCTGGWMLCLVMITAVSGSEMPRQS